MDDKTSYWVEIAEYDLDTAQAMFDTGRYLYERLDDSQKDLLDSLEPLNIQARCPEDKDRVFRSLTTDRCSELLAQTKELYQWIKATL